METSRSIAFAVLVCHFVCGLGCARARGAEPRRDFVVEVKTPVEVSAAPPPPSPFDGRLEERAIFGSPDHLALVFVVPSRSFEVRIAIVPERFACTAGPWPLHESSPWEQEPIVGATSILCDPDAPSVKIEPNEKGIAIDGVPYDTGGPLRIPTGPVPRPARSCPGGPTHLVDVEIDRVMPPADPTNESLRFLAPAIGMDVTQGAGSSIDVRSQRYFAAHMMTVGVHHCESSTLYTLDARDGVLSLVYESRQMAGPDHRGTIGRWMLPCDARVAYHEQNFRHPTWGPLGGCVVCGDVQSACEKPCFESLTDEDAALTPAGEACVSHCRTLCSC